VDRIGKALSVCCVAALPLAAPAAAAPSAATATAKAEVLQPLTLVNTSPLSFGSFSAGGSSGTVVIDAETGARSVSGDVVAMGGEVSAASFTGYTSGNRQVKVSTPSTSVLLTRAGGSETMAITAFTLDDSTPPADNRFAFKVGGTLAVSPRQPEGSYEGTFEVIADYQ
jgi:hypothetical protein